MGLTFGQVAAQVRSLGMKISQVTSVRDLRISDSAHMTQAVEDFVRQQGQLEVTFFSIGNDNLGHILGAFVDAEGTLRLFDVKGFYNGLGEVFASNPRLEGSWLRGLMSVQGTRYLPRWIDPETADAARSILSVVGIQVTPALIGDANATLDQMKSDFAAWQAGLKDTFGTNGNASISPLPGSSPLGGASSPGNVVLSSTDNPPAQAPKTTILQGRVEQTDWASPGTTGNGDSSANAQRSAHQPAGSHSVSAPDSDAGPDPSSPDQSVPDSLTTIHGTLPDPEDPDSLTTIHGALPEDGSATDAVSSGTPTSTYTDDQSDGDQQSGQKMVDDQVGTVGGADDSGPTDSTDTGDPDAQLTTSIAMLPDSPTDSAASTYADDPSDGDQQSGPQMVDDQVGTVGSAGDSGPIDSGESGPIASGDSGPNDTGDPGAQLSTSIAMLPNSPADSPTSTYTDDQGDGDQPSGPQMVDDQVGTVGSADDSGPIDSGDSGPNDTGDPDAQLTTSIAILPNSSADSATSTYTDDQSDDDLPSGPQMVDDQVGTIDSADDTGPTDTGDPDAQLTTSIAILPNSSADSATSTYTDDQSDDDLPSGPQMVDDQVGTVGSADDSGPTDSTDTGDPGAQLTTSIAMLPDSPADSPTSTYTDDPVDGDQPNSGPQMVDDQVGTVGSADQSGPIDSTDTGDPDAQLATSIAMLPNSPADSATSTYTDDQSDGDQQSGPQMVDDQVGTVGSAGESGPTDTGDPGAQLTTSIAMLPNTSADLPTSTYTDDQSDGDGTAVATPGTIDWLNPGAENDPLFADTDNRGDDDQQTGPGMIDDQGNAFGSLTDSGSATDPDEQGDGVSTTVATPGTIDWLNPGAEDSPLFNDSETDWSSGLSISDQPSGDDRQQ